MKEKYATEAAAEYRKLLKARAAAGGGGEGSGETPDSAPATAPIRRRASSSAPVHSFADVPRDLAWSDSFRGFMPVVYRWIVGRRGLPASRLPAAAAIWGGFVYGLSRAFPARSTSLRIAGTAIGAFPAALFFAAVAFMSRGMSRNRLTAFKSARNLLLDRVGKGRARRGKSYDLFLPPEKEDGGEEDEASAATPPPSVSVGLIFFPGATVDHTAYASIAAALSDEGIVVAVVNLEPLRCATDVSGADVRDALRIMYEVIESGSVVPAGRISEWALGGHSMGSNAAFNLAVKMRPGISKLVLWEGLGKPEHMDGTLLDAKIDAVIINTTEDGLLKSQQQAFEASKLKLPPEEGNKRGGKSRFIWIEGGNHSGFGHYGPQIWPKRDNERSITLEKQQSICVKETANFLLGRVNHIHSGGSDKAKRD